MKDPNGRFLDGAIHPFHLPPGLFANLTFPSSPDNLPRGFIFYGPIRGA